MNDLFQLAHHPAALGKELILVTLTRVEGSSYRRAGARLLVTPTSFHGLVSGGCLESEVARRCRSMFETGEQGRSLRLDTREYLGCDGRLEFWCERMEARFFAGLRDLFEKRVPWGCATFPEDPQRGTVLCEKDPGAGAFFEPLWPPLQLLAFGSGPDVPPLLEIACAMQWLPRQVVLASDPALARAGDRSWTVLPTAERVHDLGPDPWTACVVMNHHMGRDLDLVRTLWPTPVPFLGLLGSRKRRDQLLETLASHSDLDLEARELFAPVGLQLGGEGPAAIALEIGAQVLQVLAKGCGQPRGSLAP